MLSRVFTSSALLKEPSRAAHELNAIGLCAKVANIFGVNPMFLVKASRVGFESAGTCSGLRAALLGIVVSATYWSSASDRGPENVFHGGRLLFAWRPRDEMRQQRLRAMAVPSRKRCQAGFRTA